MKKGLIAIIVVTMLMTMRITSYANTAFVDEKGRVYVWYEESDIHCVIEPKYQIFSDHNWIICDVYVVEEDLMITGFTYKIGEEPKNEEAILKDIELAKDEES